MNTHSAPGRNIPADLHQEHLNRLCKESVRGLRANKTEKAIIHVGKILGTLAPLLDNYDIDNNVGVVSGAHRTSSIEKDRDLIVQHLHSAKFSHYKMAGLIPVFLHLETFCIPWTKKQYFNGSLIFFSNIVYSINECK